MEYKVYLIYISLLLSLISLSAILLENSGFLILVSLALVILIYFMISTGDSWMPGENTIGWETVMTSW